MQITKANAEVLLKPGRFILVMGRKAEVVSFKGTKLYYKFTKSGGKGFMDIMYINPDHLVQSVQ